MSMKGLPMTLEAIENNIWDIAGLRVICSFPEDVYLVKKCILAQDDIRLIKEKDYIMMAMDFWASLEHKLRYKRRWICR